MERPFFSVIIVNYNGGEFLQKAINSLVSQTFDNFEVWIVDNGSKDSSMRLLDLSSLPNSNVVMVGRNAGFAEGNNIAAKRANGDWLALLNADAIASNNWLEVLANTIEQYPSYSMIASVQHRIVELERLDGVGDNYSAFGYPWRGGFMWPVSKTPNRGECFSPCGASAAYKRSTFLEHGGFDESYFCFVEDVDLGFRMRLAGEHCLFEPSAVVRHFGGGLSEEKSEFSVFHGIRNSVWTYFGNMPTVALYITFPGHVLMSSYLALRYVHTSYGKNVRRGLMAGWSEAWRVRRSKKEIRSAKATSNWKLLRSFAWNPFALSMKSPHITGIPTHYPSKD